MGETTTRAQALQSRNLLNVGDEPSNNLGGSICADDYLLGRWWRHALALEIARQNTADLLMKVRAGSTLPLIMV
jgi:hypothetical protein